MIDDYPLLSQAPNPVESDIEDKIYQSGREFEIEALVQMRIEIPFRDDIIQSSNVLELTNPDPKVWNTWMIKYDNIIAPDLRDQFYRETKNLQSHFKLGGALYWLIETNRGNPISLWTHKKMEEEYPLVSQLAKALLLIPYSSACVERTFSDFKTIKTNKRNCLCRESLEACLLANLSSF